MKKSKICSMLFAILMCISNAFAIKYIDVELRIANDGEKLIGFLIREGEERKTFWVCCLREKLPKKIKRFLYKINGLTIPETSPMYNSMMEACKEYDNERDAYPGLDFQKGIIHLFDYSPNNKHFKTIINNLQILSGYRFNLNLLEGCITA